MNFIHPFLSLVKLESDQFFKQVYEYEGNNYDMKFIYVQYTLLEFKTLAGDEHVYRPI